MEHLIPDDKNLFFLWSVNQTRFFLSYLDAPDEQLRSYVGKTSQFSQY